MPRPLIVVDIGNSKLKIGLFATGLPADFGPPTWFTSLLPQADLETVRPQLPSEPADWFVSSVQRETERRLAEWVREQRPNDLYRRLTFQDVPLPIAVDFPERVGMDRLAAAVAANSLRDPAHAAIIVNAGSAITVDLVTPSGEYQGGAIIPGIAMASRALNANTDLLPWVQEISPDDPPAVIGKSTDKAIRSGLFWGTVGAVRELVLRESETAGAPTEVFISGGDGRQFIRFLAPPVTFRPDLVLVGIAIMSAKKLV